MKTPYVVREKGFDDRPLSGRALRTLAPELHRDLRARRGPRGRRLRFSATRTARIRLLAAFRDRISMRKSLQGRKSLTALENSGHLGRRKRSEQRVGFFTRVRRWFSRRQA